MHCLNLQVSADALSEAERAELRERASRLLAGVYRSIGLAAVANELELPPDDLDPEMRKAVKRGARYLNLVGEPPDTALNRPGFSGGSNS